MPVLPSYRNLSIDLLWKSMDWFLYEDNTTNFERIHFIHVVFCFKLWTLNLLLSSNLSLFRWILYKILVTNIRFCVSVFVFDTQQHFREILNLTLNFTRLLFFSIIIYSVAHLQAKLEALNVDELFTLNTWDLEK